MEKCVGSDGLRWKGGDSIALGVSVKEQGKHGWLYLCVGRVVVDYSYCETGHFVFSKCSVGEMVET